MKYKKQILKFLKDNRTMIDSLMSGQELKSFGNQGVVGFIVEDIKKQIKEESEENQMAETKTKQELEEEISGLKQQIAQLEKYKKYDEAAEESWVLIQSWIKSGFSEEQAFELLKIIIGNATKKTSF